MGNNSETNSRVQKGDRANVLIRLLLAHVYEALTIVKEISQASTLRESIEKCDERTVELFQELERFMASDKNEDTR
jgi:hypothetical protein